MAETERRALKRLAQASSERVDQVRRARALLTVAAGGSFADAARAAGLRTAALVAKLVTHFNRQGLVALSIASRRGRNLTCDAATRAEIVATAQTAPDSSTGGTATWLPSTFTAH